MKKQKIFQLCPGCGGTGKVSKGDDEQVCTNGMKKIEWGYLKVEEEEEDE